MKRDPDLVRDILLAIEIEPIAAPRRVQLYARLDYEDADVDGHLTMLSDAGFVELVDKGQHHRFCRLTWQGHEFIENTRDPGLWAETKEKAAKAGSLSIPILTEIATSLIKAKLGLP